MEACRLSHILQLGVIDWLRAEARVLKLTRRLHIMKAIKRARSPEEVAVEHLGEAVNSIHISKRGRTSAVQNDEKVFEEDGGGTTMYTIKGGVKNGTYQTWYACGQRREMATYVDGREEGLVQQWFPSGQPYMLYTSRGGLKEGAAFRFYSNGVLAAHEQYASDKEDGLATYYYESGAKQLEMLFERGRVLWIQHYEAEAE